MASALRAVAKALNRKIEAIPANPAYLTTALKGVSPAMAGLKVARWRNVISLLRKALKHVRLAHVPGRYRAPLAPAWAALYALIEDRGTLRGLSKFMRYCTDEGIEPASVDDQIVARYGHDLQNGGVNQNARPALRTTCVAWNAAVAAIPTWPRQTLAVPDHRQSYALPWTCFPATLKADVDAYLDHLAGKDQLRTLRFKPVRPATVVTRRKQLHEYLSALVHRGHDPATLRSLHDVVAIETIKDGARFFLERSNGKPSVQLGNIVGVITAVARHWVKVEEEHVDELRALGQRVTPPSDGLANKTRLLLGQFDDPANVRALIILPQKIFKETREALRKLKAQGAPLTRRHALELQT
ncbi:MAG: hypothetical protein JSR21_22745, partial [Proteobacteria bacterium]|nr:hypothetical protein [Pseudomonadota bacterium]